MCNVLHEQKDIESRNIPRILTKISGSWFQIKILLKLNEWIVGSLLIYQLNCLLVLNMCYEEKSMLFIVYIYAAWI